MPPIVTRKYFRHLAPSFLEICLEVGIVACKVLFGQVGKFIYKEHVARSFVEGVKGRMLHHGGYSKILSLPESMSVEAISDGAGHVFVGGKCLRVVYEPMKMSCRQKIYMPQENRTL